MVSTIGGVLKKAKKKVKKTVKIKSTSAKKGWATRRKNTKKKSGTKDDNKMIKGASILQKRVSHSAKPMIRKLRKISGKEK